MPLMLPLGPGIEIRDLKEALEMLRTALKNLVIGIEHDSDGECLPLCIEDAYKEARTLLGDPVVLFPGGEWDEHYHYLGETSDNCDLCEQYADNAEAQQVCPKDDATLDALIETIRTS